MVASSTQTIEVPERNDEQVEKKATQPETKPTDFVIKVSGYIPA